ncbi:hypothetical protein JCM11491_001892 [Sporobolomyces phaffii]
MSRPSEGLSVGSTASYSEPLIQPPTLGFSQPRKERGMDLNRLLNEPLPRSSSPSGQTASVIDGTRRETGTSFTPCESHPGAPGPTSNSTPPPSRETSDEYHSEVPRSFTDAVLCSSSRATIEAALEAFRRESHSVADFQHATNLSIYAVQESFKSLESWAGTQLDLWVWSQITWLTELARVPTFPLSADKMALLLSVYVDLPCSKNVREMIRHRQTLLEPDQVLLLLHGMEVAGKASREMWPIGTSLDRTASYYPSTALVRSLITYVVSLPSKPLPLVNNSCAVSYNRHKAAQKPALTGFAPPKPPPPPRSAVHPPVSNFYGPTTNTPTAISLSRPAPSHSLRDLCAQLPAILRDLKTLPDDPQVFDIAQIRFQNASSAPAYVTRMPDLVQAAVLYTNITALLCFPTYPIDAVKLAVFALAFTPGPLGQILLRSSPEFAQQQQYSRLSGSDMEKLMKDLTAVRDITRGGSVGISEGELRDWHEWLRELTLDWRSLDPLPTKGIKDRARPSQPAGGPPRKRAKLSPSPTNSERLRESVKTVSDRPSISQADDAKAPPSDRSTPAPSVTESVSSPEVSTKPLSKTKPKPKAVKKPRATAAAKKVTAAAVSKARKGTPATSSRASTPASSVASVAPSVPSRPVIAPRWKPEVKGKIPDHIPMPPVPPIRPSTRWLKRNRIKADDGSVEEDGGDEDEEEEAPRTIAASRPKRRGGLQMIPVDIEALWSLARKVGYTEEAMAEEAKAEQT